MLKIFGGLGALLQQFHIFWWAFILWLMALLVLKKNPILKMVEVADLATMIFVLGAVITTLLTIITGKLGITRSPALALKTIDMKNKLHCRSPPQVFNIWLIAVSACGLSRLTGAPFSKALLTWEFIGWPLLSSSFQSVWDGFAL